MPSSRADLDGLVDPLDELHSLVPEVGGVEASIPGDHPAQRHDLVDVGVDAGGVAETRGDTEGTLLLRQGLTGDANDACVADCHIPAEPGRPGPVHDGTATNQEVPGTRVRGRLPLLRTPRREEYILPVSLRIVLN